MPKLKEKPFKETHLKLFKKEFEKWINYFGLLDFDIQIKISENNSDTLAVTTVLHQDKIAVISITKLWDELNDYKIRETAFHEVIEVLLSRLRNMACGTFSDEAVNETTHAVIARLQNSIFKKYWR
jgi:hypothetical protein